MIKNEDIYKMKNLCISEKVIEKLASKHRVTRREVEQCFENLCGKFLTDNRENHKSDPPTHWFIAPTNANRRLKVVFIFKDGNFHLRTAYEPNADEARIYNGLAN